MLLLTTSLLQTPYLTRWLWPSTNGDVDDDDDDDDDEVDVDVDK